MQDITRGEDQEEPGGRATRACSGVSPESSAAPAGWACAGRCARCPPFPPPRAPARHEARRVMAAREPIIGSPPRVPTIVVTIVLYPCNFHNNPPHLSLCRARACLVAGIAKSCDVESDTTAHIQDLPWRTARDHAARGRKKSATLTGRRPGGPSRAGKACANSSQCTCIFSASASGHIVIGLSPSRRPCIRRRKRRKNYLSQKFAPRNNRHGGKQRLERNIIADELDLFTALTGRKSAAQNNDI